MKDSFKELVIKGLAKKSLKALFLKYPFLSWGPLGWFVNFLTNKIIESLGEYLDKIVDIKRIVFKNEELEEEYARSSVKLKIIADSFDQDTQEYKDAKDEAIKSFHDFVMFDIAG